MPLDKINQVFSQAGAQIFLVGGCVRDRILGRSPKDIDLATDQLPEQTTQLMKSIGAKVIDKLGGNYGTVHCILDDESIEITTYRANETYERGDRRPKVQFSNSLQDDLIRRDFTCNAVAAQLNWTIVQEGISLEGLSAIHRKTIDTPSDPAISFSDDPLRILRAYRFRAQLGFEFADRIRPAIRDWAKHLHEISRERCREEMVKLLSHPGAVQGLRHQMEDGVLHEVIPELTSQVGFNQDNIHHHLELWEHTLLATQGAIDQGASWMVVLATLLHDVGKPTSWQLVYRCIACGNKDRYQAGETPSDSCNSCGGPSYPKGKSYLGHDQVGADLTKAILDRLRFSNEEIFAVSKMVAKHIKWSHHDWNRKLARKYLNDMGDLANLHIQLMIADRLAHAPGYNNPNEFEELTSLLANLDTQAVVANKPLIDGTQIMTLTGLGPGKEVGRLLSLLKEAQLSETVTTEAEAREFILSSI